jgi:hypothetical protein
VFTKLSDKRTETDPRLNRRSIPRILGADARMRARGGFE